MRMIARRLLATMIVGLVVGHCTAAQAVPFEELSRGKRARYTAEAVAVNTVPGVSAAAEPRCIQGYILCKLTFALFSGVVAGETLVLGGGGDMGLTTSPGPKTELVVTSRRWMVRRICLPDPPTGLNRDIRHPAGLPFFVTPSFKRPLGGAGILTCCPSLTPFGLSLGTD